MTVIIKENFGFGGRGLAPGGAGKPTLAVAIRSLIDDGNGLRPSGTFGVMDGLRSGAPSTGSTQASGVGNTDWNVNVAAGAVVCNGVEKEFAAQADYDVHSGSLLLADGESVYAWLVAKEAAGTVSMDVVKGAAATTGEQIAPTDAEITAAVTHANWTKLGKLLVNRTGDTTLTQSQSNLDQEKWGGPLAAAYTLNTVKG